MISSQYNSIGLARYNATHIFICSIAILFLTSLTAFAVEEEWVLSGTFVSDQHSHAMFVDANGDELLIPLGEEFQGCEITHITHKTAKIQCLDQAYSIDLRTSFGDLALQSKNINSHSHKKVIVLPKQEVTEYVAQRQRVVSEIAFLPVMHEKKLKGYAISKIRPNTFASSLGLYNGDIVTSVNGVSATEVTEFFQILDNLAHTPEVSIQVDRYGHSLDMTYFIQ